MKHPKGLCQECHKKLSHYSLYRTHKGIKEWIDACPTCEGKIGDENLLRWRREHEIQKEVH